MCLEVRDCPARIETWFAHKFGGPISKPTAADVHFHFLASPDADHCSRVPKSLTWHRDQPFWGHLSRGILHLTDGFSLAEVDYDRHLTHFKLHPSSLKNPIFFMRSFVLLCVLEMLRAKKLYFMHAAACVSPDQKTHVFFGQGGAGKSSLSLACIKHGWKLISDDGLLLSSARTIYPFEKELALKQTIADFESMIKKTETRGKWVIPFHAIPAQVASTATIDRIWILEPPSDDPFRRALTHLVDENPMIFTDERFALPQLQSFHHLLNQTPLSFLPLHISPEHYCLNDIFRQFDTQQKRQNAPSTVTL